MDVCKFLDAEGNEIVIKPDGENELDACEYVEISRLKNVTISILKCRRCGRISIGWMRQADTEEVEDGNNDRN